MASDPEELTLSDVERALYCPDSSSDGASDQVEGGGEDGACSGGRDDAMLIALAKPVTAGAKNKRSARVAGKCAKSMVP